MINERNTLLCMNFFNTMLISIHCLSLFCLTFPLNNTGKNDFPMWKHFLFMSFFPMFQCWCYFLSRQFLSEHTSRFRFFQGSFNLFNCNFRGFWESSNIDIVKYSVTDDSKFLMVFSMLCISLLYRRLMKSAVIYTA